MNYRTIVVLSVLSLAVACGDSPLAPSEAIIGSWQIESVSGGALFTPVVYTFSTDGNLTFSFPLSEVTVTRVTTYAITGNQLTINGFIADVDESGSELAVPTESFLIAIDGTTLTMTDANNDVVTLRRV